jgi:hypothetical protein
MEQAWVLQQEFKESKKQTNQTVVLKKVRKQKGHANAAVTYTVGLPTDYVH